MNLKDLGPDAAKIVLRGKEYNLEYTFLSQKELEIIYGCEDEYMKAYFQIWDALGGTGELQSGDLVSFLYAGLLHADIWPEGLIVEKHGVPCVVNRAGCLDFIRYQMMAGSDRGYATLIVVALMIAFPTPEIMEIFNIMSYDEEGKKKVPAAQELNGLSDLPMH